MTQTVTEPLGAQNILPDLADPDNYAEDDGLDLLARFRNRDRVSWNTSYLVEGFWAITGWAEAREFFLDSRSYTSELGMNVGQSDKSAQSAAGKMLIVSDPPRHQIMRRIIAPLLDPKFLEALRPSMERVIHDALEPLLDGHTFDCVANLTTYLPAFTICKLLGVPDSDVRAITDWVRIAYDSGADDQSANGLAKFEANAELFDYFGRLLRRRRQFPQDDIVNKMLTRRLQDSGLTEEEIVLNLHGLITGGNETTRHASTGGILAFADFPQQWDSVRRDLALLPEAVEEILRWTSPSLNLMRTCVSETSLSGKTIRNGDRVSVWFPIVNRDPLKFDHPNAFIANRENNAHLTFGMGLHACVGGAMARHELSLLVASLARQVRRVERAGPVRRLRSNLLWGIDSAPIRFQV